MARHPLDALESPELSILVRLAEKPMSKGELARAGGVTAATAEKIIGRLTALGIIETTKVPQGALDVNVIRMTARGKAHLAAVLLALDQSFAALGRGDA